MLGALARSLFGTANDRIVKGFDKPVAKINALEPEFSKLSDEELRGKTAEFRERLAKGETLDNIQAEALRHGARGCQARTRPAPLRRPAQGRHGPP